MDLASGAYRASAIATGHDSGREYVNIGYITGHYDGKAWRLSGTVHSSLRCRWPHNPTDLNEVPVFIEDGILTVTSQGHERQVEWCDRCPPDLEWDWQEQGTCYNGTADFFVENHWERQKVIDTYCNQCPVISECLEFGATHIEDGTGIWGGLSFTTRNSRKEAEVKIESQRVRIREGL